MDSICVPRSGWRRIATVIGLLGFISACAARESHADFGKAERRQGGNARGRLVVPLGQRYQQNLYLFKKVDGVLKAEPLQPTYFVPMVGRAEEERVVQAKPSEPVLINGDFKKVADDLPIGWYYIRQGKVESTGPTPGGASFVLHNDAPNRTAYAFQAVGIDGRWIEEIDLSSWFRGKNLRPGSLPEQQPCLAIVFFNGNRKPIARHTLGPSSGTYDWVQ